MFLGKNLYRLFPIIRNATPRTRLKYILVKSEPSHKRAERTVTDPNKVVNHDTKRFSDAIVNPSIRTTIPTTILFQKIWNSDKLKRIRVNSHIPNNIIVTPCQYFFSFMFFIFILLFNQKNEGGRNRPQKLNYKYIIKPALVFQ